MSEEQIQTNFSKYGQPFQLKTIHLFIKDKVFRNKIKSILKTEYFDNKYLQWFYDVTIEVIDKTGGCPDFDDLKTLIETRLSSPAIYLRTLESLKTTTLENKGFIEDEVIKFCFTKYALSQSEREKNYILLGEFDKAKQVAHETYKAQASEVSQLDLKKDFRQLFDSANHTPVPSPFPTFNKISKGGPGAGDLVVILGQSGFGKSNFAVAYTRHVVKQGKKVAYISLETNVTQLASRFIAGLTNINQEHLVGHPTMIEKAIEQLDSDVRFLQIKATQARVDYVKQQINALHADGFFPEFIVIDGLNQLKLPKGISHANSNDKFEYLAEEVRDLAKELQIPIAILFQMNRCLALDTIVTLQNGETTLDKVKQGDLIETHEGFKKVTEVFPKNLTPSYKIKTKSGKEIICSGEHEFPTSEGLQCINTNLKVGSKLYIKK